MIYLTPFARLPLDWTVDHVAILLGTRWWFGTELGTDGQSITSSAGHLVDAVHLTSLDASATGAAASRKVGSVPSRRARHVVARPGDSVRPAVHRTQMRVDPLAVQLSDALDDRLLDS